MRRESDPSAQEAAGSLIMVPTNPAAAAVTGSAGPVAGGQMAAALPEVTGQNADAIDNLAGQGQAARTVTIARPTHSKLAPQLACHKFSRR